MCLGSLRVDVAQATEATCGVSLPKEYVKSYLGKNPSTFYPPYHTLRKKTGSGGVFIHHHPVENVGDDDGGGNLRS